MLRYYLVFIIGIAIYGCGKSCEEETITFLSAERKQILNPPVDSILYFQSSRTQQIDTFVITQLYLANGSRAWRDKEGDGEYDCMDCFEQLGYVIERTKDDVTFFTRFESKTSQDNSHTSIASEADIELAGTLIINGITYEDVLYVTWDRENTDIQKVYYHYGKGYIRYVLEDGEVFNRIP